MSPLFSPTSRYRRIADVATIDGHGRATTSRDFRPLPDQPGTFQHVVSASDRLDHLAFKYYDQPRDWWRILDANPAFIDPESLLGDDRFVEVLLPVSWSGAEPRWSELQSALLATPGIGAALMGSETMPIPTATVSDGPVAFTIAGAMLVELNDSVQTQAVGGPLAAALAANLVVLAQPLRVEALGTAAWRISELASNVIWTFGFDPGPNVVAASPGTLEFAWSAAIAYNRALLGPQDLAAIAAATGFSTGMPTEIRRVGKPVVIPPRTA